jgi:hypothetical protein
MTVLPLVLQAGVSFAGPIDRQMNLEREPGELEAFFGSCRFVRWHAVPDRQTAAINDALLLYGSQVLRKTSVPSEPHYCFTLTKFQGSPTPLKID